MEVALRYSLEQGHFEQGCFYRQCLGGCFTQGWPSSKIVMYCPKWVKAALSEVHLSNRDGTWEYPTSVCNIREQSWRAYLLQSIQEWIL